MASSQFNNPYAKDVKIITYKGAVTSVAAEQGTYIALAKQGSDDLTNYTFYGVASANTGNGGILIKAYDGVPTTPPYMQIRNVTSGALNAAPEIKCIYVRN